MWVARFASLFALLVLVRAQSLCDTVSKGDKCARAVNLPDVLMSAGFNNFYYNIPEYICGPYNYYHVGTTAAACDVVLKPQVLLINLRQVQVFRPGYVPLPGVLRLTVYCQDPPLTQADI